MTVCRHRSVSLNNEKICREIGEDKMAVCEKTERELSDLNSACSKVFLGTSRGHSKRPNIYATF
jgi:hypothetical protein